MTDYLIVFGLESETDASGDVRCSWKDGVNVGVSGILRYYPTVDVRVALVDVGEDAAWPPVKLIDEACSEPGPRRRLPRNVNS